MRSIWHMMPTHSSVYITDRDLEEKAFMFYQVILCLYPETVFHAVHVSWCVCVYVCVCLHVYVCIYVRRIPFCTLFLYYFFLSFF